MKKKINEQMIEQSIRAQEEQIKKLKDYCESHNKRPLTRRELLGAGLLSFSATMTLPSLSSLLLPSMAYGQSADCPSSVSGSEWVPFVNLNLSGGAMLAANYVPMDAGGQPLPSYNKMGLGNGAVPIEREFGNAPFAGDGISKLLIALRESATAATLSKTAFVAVPVRLRDDSGMNRLDISGMVSKAGLIGESLPNLGVRASDTGVNQTFAKAKPPTPLRVTRYSDLSGALSLGSAGPLSSFNSDQKLSLLNLISKLSQSQVRKVQENTGGKALASLVNCSNQKNVEIAQATPPNLDVRSDSALSSVWGVNTGTGENNQSVIFGSMVKASLLGLSGTISLEQGGYDYHNNTRTTGDQRDTEAGRTIGRILESAALLNKKVFIYVTSDGSCVSPTSEDRNAPWRSDRGEAGIAYILVFDPTGRPKTSGFQIGQFTSGQAADDKFITGGSAEMAASAVFANYLKLNNKLNLLGNFIGNNTFSTAQLDQILKFG